MAKDNQALMVIVDPDTGELVEINLERGEQASQADVREAKKLDTVEGPFALIGVRIQQGKSAWAQPKNGEAPDDWKEYAELLYVQTRAAGMEMAVTASDEVIASLRRVQARGLGTPQRPLYTKTEQAETSAGFKVHKLARLTDKEEASLKASLS